MCGIFAIASNEKQTNAAQTVLKGLKKLEYRGYDSWGIVVKDKEVLKVDKHTGKITQAKTHLPKSQVGLGHTRWATHGGVTQNNAHPFLDCNKKIAMVHNGIIDNYQELKKSFKKKHIIKSQTDSEVLLHLIEELELKHSFSTAVRLAFKKCQGLNAVLVIKDNQIVAAKTGSPLVIGLSKNQNYIASDLWSLLDHTKRVIFLDDGQMAALSSEKVVIQDIKIGKRLKPKIQTINWQSPQSRKKDFPHFMLKEIYEQPEIIQRLIVDKQSQTKKLSQLIKKSDNTFLVACGTAAYAAIAGRYLFSELAKVHVSAVAASEFIYADYLTSKSLVIAMSQSGETIDTIQSVQLAQKHKAKVTSLVNVLGSTLYRLSHDPILIDCGPEIGVASTKAFTAKITLLLMTAHYLSGQKNNGLKDLQNSAKACKLITMPQYRRRLKNLAQKIKDSLTCFVVGRRTSYPVALEIALKIKEISYIHAEGLAGGELKHGPIALIEKGTPCIVVAPEDESYHDSISGAMEMKARGGLIIGITSRPHEVFDIILPIKNCKEASLIPAAVVGQLLAYELAVAKNIDPDKPRNLAKSVTVK